jgi:hypothetical protein
MGNAVRGDEKRLAVNDRELTEQGSEPCGRDQNLSSRLETEAELTTDEELDTHTDTDLARVFCEES